MVDPRSLNCAMYAHRDTSVLWDSASSRPLPPGRRLFAIRCFKKRGNLLTGPSRRGTISLLKESLAGLRAWDIGWAAYMFENRLIAKMFENRGWSEDYIREIDRDSHGPMMNVEQLIDAMDAARNSGFEFTLLSDFDMDGIMSGTLGFAGLSELGFKVNLFMPEPDEGYGFKERTIGRLVAQYPNTDVIITSDTAWTPRTRTTWTSTSPTTTRRRRSR